MHKNKMYFIVLYTLSKHIYYILNECTVYTLCETGSTHVSLLKNESVHCAALDKPVRNMLALTMRQAGVTVLCRQEDSDEFHRQETEAKVPK